MIDLGLYSVLNDKIETLRNTSKDDSDPRNIQYMTSSTLEVVNFDLVKRDYANRLGLSEEVAKSVDAILLMENGIVFIEFKNGRVENSEVKNKARDSLLIFLDIIGENITFSRSNIDFVVVYNPGRNRLSNQERKRQLQETPSRLVLANHFLEKVDKEFIRFDLERYETLYFRKVHTYSKERFEEYLKSTFPI